MSAYNGVVFDLDGTLLNTLEDIGNAMNRVLKHHGFPAHGMDRYRFFIGDGSAMLVRRSIPPDSITDTLVSECLEAFLADYNQSWNIRTKPYAGVQGLLDCLQERGIKMSVLSNKPHEFTRRCVASFFQNWEMYPVIGRRTGLPPKPDPAGATEIARALDLSPASMLYAGDSAVDMQTAVNAGMMPAGVLWGFRDAEELASGGAQHLISAPEELLSLL